MNLAEFKAWFEGYTENMRDVPSAKQWTRIKARVDEITPQATEVRYFYDHYWRPYYASAYAYTGSLTGGCATVTGLTSQQNASSYTMTSTEAFNMLGKADALSEAA